MSSNNSKTRLIVLASGRGSNFKAICEAVSQGHIPHSQVVGLVCNKKQAPVLDIANALQVPAFVVESKGKPHDAYEAELLERMQELRPDLVCLAGYMKILGTSIIRAFAGRMVNIHPSLLPQFRGLNAQKQALEAGVSETGCSVHWVTETLDSGPVILQAKVPVLKGDTEQSLSQRLLPVEHQTYVQALAKIVGEIRQSQPNRK